MVTIILSLEPRNFVGRLCGTAAAVVVVAVTCAAAAVDARKL